MNQAINFVGDDMGGGICLDNGGPLIIMFVVNLVVIIRKLQLSPLQFLRRNLSKKRHKKAINLSRKTPFIHGFRSRIILQNIPNYITLFLGVIIFMLLMFIMSKQIIEKNANAISMTKILGFSKGTYRLPLHPSVTWRWWFLVSVVMQW